MKITQENIDELLRLGFRKSHLMSIGSKGEYWTLPDGWSFEISEINSFYHLKNRLKKSINEDKDGKWTPETRSAYLKLVRKYPDPLKGATQTRKQKLARTLTQARKNASDVNWTIGNAVHQIQKNQIAIMEFLLDT